MKRKFRISVEDESTLERRLNFTLSWPLLMLAALGIIVVAGLIGIFIFASTPLKNHLPGYLKDSERAATEEQHLRLDSLNHIYEVNEAYITGILNALNPPDPTEDPRIRSERKQQPLATDSLMPPSLEEQQFMERIRERDKYNIDFASPAAAQTMLFAKVNKAGVISEDSKEKYQAEILLPIGSTVSSVAEGKVISVATSPRAAGGYEVIIQHPKGFLSKSSRLANLTVRPGDRVAAGQIIANGVTANGLKGNRMVFELWHDGDRLIPSRYLP